MIEETYSANPTNLVKLTDTKFSWIVACSATVIGVISGSLEVAFGLLFLELLDYFDESRQSISWIQSVMNGVCLFIGPVIGKLITKYDCRRVGMAGSCILFVAIFASSFAPNVSVMILLYGLIGGIGLGLLYMPSITVVGMYFEKRRALATSIATCGTSLGGFIFAPISQFLIDKYSWSGTMLILSAICFNGLALSAVFKPIGIVIEDAQNNSTIPYGKSDEHVCLRNKFLGKDGFPNKVSDKVSLFLTHLNQVDLLTSSDQDRLSEQMYIRMEETKGKENQEENLPKTANGNQSFSRVMMSLLRDPMFMAFSLSGFFGIFTYFVPLMFVPQLADSFGMPSSRGQFFVSAISLSNAITRLLIGLALDRKLVDPVLLLGVVTIFGGVATMCVRYFTSFALLMIYSIVYGTSGAVLVTLRTIILADLFGASQLPYTFGLSIMFQGAASFLGPPVIGAVIDATGSTSDGFLVAGASLALSGILAIAVFIKRRLGMVKERNSQSLWANTTNI